MSRNLALIALTITLAASAAACTSSTVEPVVEETSDVERVPNEERSEAPPAKPIDTGVRPMKEGQQDGTNERPQP